jgi:hypothetical protein
MVLGYKPDGHSEFGPFQQGAIFHLKRLANYSHAVIFRIAQQIGMRMLPADELRLC